MKIKCLKYIFGAVFLLSGFITSIAQLKPGNVSAPVELWLKADMGVTAGSNNNVSSWADQSGNSRNYEATANYPTFNQSSFLMNFQPSIDFRGGTQKLIGPAHFLNNTKAYYVFYVSRQTASNSTFATVYAFNGGRNNAYGWISGKPSFHTAGTGSAYTYTHQGGNGRLFGINAVMLPNNTANAQRSYMNGAINTIVFGARALNMDAGLGVIGSSVSTTSGTLLFNGNIQEIIVLSGAVGNYLSDDELRKVNSYLALKYGISLDFGDYVCSDGTTIVWNRYNNAPYNTNIFGIGRDDASGLYQKQSKSENSSGAEPTVYTGNAVMALNSQNNGSLADKQYLIIGRHNNETGSAMPLAFPDIINDGNIFENGIITPATSNIQSPRYKAQITGVAAMTVKLKTSASIFTHLLVSKTEDFNDKSAIKAYELVNGVAEVDIDENYKFLKYIGLDPGPGGVNTGLLLWLKADEEGAITTVDYPLSDPGLRDFGYAKNPAAIPTVDSWRDVVRGHTWTYAAGGTASSHRRPVKEEIVLEMNYHPAIRFWGISNSASAYLSNPLGIASATPSSHTALFMINNDFGTGPRVYQMQFSRNAADLNTDGPSYGVDKEENFGQGRYRGESASTGRRNLFNVGTTTIASYYINDNASPRVPKFRFNGIEDNTANSYSLENRSMSRPSIIGVGYSPNRTVQGFMSEIIIYNGLLDANIINRDKVESYMALKYGVTLFPSPNTSTVNRFDYKFSSGDLIWPGQTGESKFITFYNRVASVIRDDIAELDNCHSISTNVGSLLHLGVAGSYLEVAGHGTCGHLENMETVTFGDNNAKGFTETSNGVCGDFDSIFNRIWLVNKKTQNNRPVNIIVGIQNNANSPIGNDSDTRTYYNMLEGAYDISLIVADSPENINAGIYKSVIPMTYLNGLWQCIYEFFNEDTYITFGSKLNRKGCLPGENAVFQGSKTFFWKDWTRNINSSNASNVVVVPSAQYGNLGDNIQVIETSVNYPSGVVPTRRYPRFINLPSRGSLEVRRRGAALNYASEVTVVVKFNNPVIPSFSVSGIGSNGNAYEVVEITGNCKGSVYSPMLSYASNRPRYEIIGNTATTKRRGNVSARRTDGMLNVNFIGGVESMTIKYRVTRGKTHSRQSIYISPITLRSVPLPPPINEDGLSFVKQADRSELLTCEPVMYTFEIQNTNCEPKTVTFNDSLPEYMKWQSSSFGLDSESSLLNPDFEPLIEKDGSKLVINNLIIPGASNLLLNAVAVFDEEAPTSEYENGANISYKQVINNIEYGKLLYSKDKQTLDSLTVITATYSERPEKFIITESYNKNYYSEDDEIEVTYKIESPNVNPVSDMFMDINFNEEFSYVPNSFKVEWLEGEAGIPAPILETSSESGSLLISGSEDGDFGFTLPKSKLQIKFKLKAPDKSGLIRTLDLNGLQAEEIVDLGISYHVYSEMDDPCMVLAVTEMNGEYIIPYRIGKKYIISNNNITTGVK